MANYLIVIVHVPIAQVKYSGENIYPCPCMKQLGRCINKVYCSAPVVKDQPKLSPNNHTKYCPTLNCSFAKFSKIISSPV